jgi:hypothetical protein
MRKVFCRGYDLCLTRAMRTRTDFDCDRCQIYQMETLTGEDLEIQTERAVVFLLTLWPELRE